MKIAKDEIVEVLHNRKGRFTAIALEDFDTDESEWFPLAVVERAVHGMAEDWVAGEKIPCRASMTDIFDRAQQRQEREVGDDD